MLTCYLVYVPSTIAARNESSSPLGLPPIPSHSLCWARAMDIAIRGSLVRAGRTGVTESEGMGRLPRPMRVHCGEFSAKSLCKYLILKGYE